MTRNRTAMDVFSMLGTNLMVILLFGLGMGVAVLEYVSMARDRMRRVEIRVRRRAARRSAA